MSSISSLLLNRQLWDAFTCVHSHVFSVARPTISSFAIHHLRHASARGLEAQIKTKLTARFFFFFATADVDRDFLLIQNAFFDFVQGQRCIACRRSMSSGSEIETRETPRR